MAKGMELYVQPFLPKRIRRLKDIAYNFWFSWNPDAVELFSSLDHPLWRRVRHNPVEFLREVSQHKLDEASKDQRSYLVQYNKVLAAFDHYMAEQQIRWYAHHFGNHRRDELITYFCAEYGVHESLPIYSGGLGVLAGDHCKSAGDLGLPFVAVGLLYRHGYFTQKIDAQGNQIAEYIDNDFDLIPVQRVIDKEGRPLIISIDVAGQDVYVNVWKVNIGRVSLYLLDTDTELNKEKDRLITYQLYVGDRQMRLSQEIILGMGGVRALKAMEMNPAVWHVNEGHPILVGLERIRSMVKEEGLSFYEALEVVRATTVFTTHTPVLAGHDTFSLELIDQYFKLYWQEVGLSRNEFISLGLENTNGFNLTRLAFKLTNFVNAVSAVHCETTSKQWEHLWSGVPLEENPIIYITDGIHAFSWIAPPMADLFDRYLGPEWHSELPEVKFWKKVDEIPDDIYWGIRQDIKRRMIGVVRANLKRQRVRNGLSLAEIREAEDIFDPEILTIGFARRFATYKRADLIFKDLIRLGRIVNHLEHPVQIIFAGKAHPADRPAQDIIRKIHTISQRPEFRRRIVLLEDYDINLARSIVFGVDLWLNVPRRPLEACGTSGQKVAVNGGINLSVLDGWWAEGYQRGNGWTVGDIRDYKDEAVQDADDSDSLYSLLEEEIIPLYYQRGEKGYSPGWVKQSKESIKTIVPIYNTDRMVREYTHKCYRPAIEAGQKRKRDNYVLARELAAWKRKVIENWPQVKLSMVEGFSPQMNFREKRKIEIFASLSKLRPKDVTVELYIKKAEEDAVIIPLKCIREESDGRYLYEVDFRPEDSGHYTISVRVIPRHSELLHKHELGLCSWL